MLSILMDMVKHSQSTENNKFAIPSQYLKKEVRDGIHFLHANKHQSYYKLTNLSLMEVASHVQSSQNRKLVIFLQYIKKNILLLFLCSIVIQNIQIFNMGPVMFVTHVVFVYYDQLWNLRASQFQEIVNILNRRIKTICVFILLILIKAKASKAAIFVF